MPFFRGQFIEPDPLRAIKHLNGTARLPLGHPDYRMGSDSGSNHPSEAELDSDFGDPAVSGDQDVQYAIALSLDAGEIDQATAAVLGEDPVKASELLEAIALDAMAVRAALRQEGRQ